MAKIFSVVSPFSYQDYKDFCQSFIDVLENRPAIATDLGDIGYKASERRLPSS